MFVHEGVWMSDSHMISRNKTVCFEGGADPAPRVWILLSAGDLPSEDLGGVVVEWSRALMTDERVLVSVYHRLDLEFYNVRRCTCLSGRSAHAFPVAHLVQERLR